MSLPIGSTIAEFRIDRILGEGGFGVVYLATDLLLSRLVALKEYMPVTLATRRPDMTVAPRSEEARRAFHIGLRSFINEARLLAKFDHPALVKVHRFWEERGTAYLVMPYYRGMTLKAFLAKRPAPPEEWLRTQVKPLLDAIHTLHAQHCYHRDIAPDNILLLPSGKPLLLDFGAARQVLAETTSGLTAILKPGYAPIEQYADAPAGAQGPWTDVYALAAVLYCAVSGAPPKTSVGRMLYDDLIPAASLGRGHYSPEFLEAIDAGLALLPEHRPQSVAAFARLLGEEIEVPSGDTTLPPTGTERPRPFDISEIVPRARNGGPHEPAPAAPVSSMGAWVALRRLPRLVVGAGAVGISLSIGAYVWWNRDRPPPVPAEPVMMPVERIAQPPDAAPVPVQSPPIAASASTQPVVSVEPTSLGAPSPVPLPSPSAVEPPAARKALAPKPRPVARKEATSRSPEISVEGSAGRRVSTTTPGSASTPITPSAPAPAQAVLPALPAPVADSNRCADLLQRVAMGQDSPALRQRLNALDCH